MVDEGRELVIGGATPIVVAGKLDPDIENIILLFAGKQVPLSSLKTWITAAAKMCSSQRHNCHVIGINWEICECRQPALGNPPLFFWRVLPPSVSFGRQNWGQYGLFPVHYLCSSLGYNLLRSSGSGFPRVVFLIGAKAHFLCRSSNLDSRTILQPWGNMVRRLHASDAEDHNSVSELRR